MAELDDQVRLLRFDAFEANLGTGELFKAGRKLKFGGQPFQLLAILLERPGEVVTRDELQKRLWPDTFVDVERNLNTSINRIRDVLGDSAESPRYVETLPRRGYRFIGSIKKDFAEDARKSETNLASRSRFGKINALVLVGAGLLVAALALIGWRITAGHLGQAVSPEKGLASEGPNPSTDSPMEFLLRSAATDFQAHRPPVVERFRHVRFGHVRTPGRAKQYQLCGEFLPQQREGKAEWTPFATIKTSGFEQYLGIQAASWCQRSHFVQDRDEDLSSTLQNRLDSMR